MARTEATFRIKIEQNVGSEENLSWQTIFELVFWSRSADTQFIQEVVATVESLKKRQESTVNESRPTIVVG